MRKTPKPLTRKQQKNKAAKETTAPQPDPPLAELVWTPSQPETPETPGETPSAGNPSTRVPDDF